MLALAVSSEDKIRGKPQIFGKNAHRHCINPFPQFSPGQQEPLFRATFSSQ